MLCTERRVRNPPKTKNQRSTKADVHMRHQPSASLRLWSNTCPQRLTPTLTKHSSVICRSTRAAVPYPPPTLPRAQSRGSLPKYVVNDKKTTNTGGRVPYALPACLSACLAGSSSTTTIKERKKRLVQPQRAACSNCALGTHTSKKRAVSRPAAGAEASRFCT